MKVEGYIKGMEVGVKELVESSIGGRINQN